ncbi:hypothetical protein Syun_023343 [Stephania yunnanensis]|uniref:Uncharacterized protein n=1 Tax=Stephania yunnanensis TaxID=152371 RepID=A0AAP0FBZ3_9MAGN
MWPIVSSGSTWIQEKALLVVAVHSDSCTEEDLRATWAFNLESCTHVLLSLAEICCNGVLVYGGCDTWSAWNMRESSLEEKAKNWEIVLQADEELMAARTSNELLEMQLDKCAEEDPRVDLGFCYWFYSQAVGDAVSAWGLDAWRLKPDEETRTKLCEDVGECPSTNPEDELMAAEFVTVLEGRVVGDSLSFGLKEFSQIKGRLKRLVTLEEADAMPAIGTHDGRQIPQTTSYRKSKQLPHVRDVVDAEASSAHSSRFSCSDPMKKKGANEGEIEGKAIWTRDKEKGRDEDGKYVDLEYEGLRDGESEKSFGGEEDEDGEGEEDEGDDEVKEESSHVKARGKTTSSSSKVVEGATDDSSRPILGGPTDCSIFTSFNNLVAAAICKNKSLAFNMYPGNISSSIDHKLDRLISIMEHLLSSGEVQVNPAMDSSYPHNYGRYEDSHYYKVEVCEICGDYSHSAHNCPYHPQYVNCHYSSHISLQPDFSGFMSYPQAPQHERNQQFHQSLSLDDMMMQVMASVPESWRTCNEIQNIDLTLPALKDVQTSFDRNSVSLQRKIDQAELCSTQPTFHPEEDVRDDTLTNLEVREDEMKIDVIEISEECEVFQIEPKIVIALNEGEDEMKIDVDSDMSEMPQIESDENQLLVLVQPPTLPCTFGKPYKGVEVRERLQIFYTADTFVLDNPDTIDSFVLEVSDELLNLK